MQEYLPIISLLVLVVVVAIGFIKKINLGFFALGAAFILGTIGVYFVDRAWAYCRWNFSKAAF